MPVSLASLDQLSARLGVTIDPESPAGIQGQAALDDASSLVREVAGSTWLDSGDSSGLMDVPALVSTITLASALRAYRNPTGAAQASVGDVSLSYGAGSLGSAIYLTRDERISLLKLVGKSTASSVGLTTQFFPVAADEIIAEVEGGGDPIPFGTIPWED